MIRYCGTITCTKLLRKTRQSFNRIKNGNVSEYWTFNIMGAVCIMLLFMKRNLRIIFIKKNII